MPNRPDGQVISLGIPQNQLNRGNYIVDSGTTDTYFDRSFRPFFNEVFQPMTGSAYSHAKVKLSREQLNALLTILIQLEGDEETNRAV